MGRQEPGGAGTEGWQQSLEAGLGGARRLQETEPGSSRCPIREGTACLPSSPQRPDPGPELPNLHGQLPPHGPRAAPLSPARHAASKGYKGSSTLCSTQVPRGGGSGRHTVAGPQGKAHCGGMPLTCVPVLTALKSGLLPSCKYCGDTWPSSPDQLLPEGTEDLAWLCHWEVGAAEGRGSWEGSCPVAGQLDWGGGGQGGRQLWVGGDRSSELHLLPDGLGGSYLPPWNSGRLKGGRRNYGLSCRPN